MAEILKFIDDASGFPTMKLVVFSGGECFLLGSDLDAAIRHARSKGVQVRCVTNGYWARTEDVAYQRLSKLKDAGLTEINFSTGDFHQRFVPQANIINGVVAALRLGLCTSVMVELQRERKIRAADISHNPRIAAALADQGDRLFTIIESPWMPTSCDSDVLQDQTLYLNRYNVHTKKGCDSVLTTIVATPKRRVGLCCGLTRELIPELNFDLLPGTSIQSIYQEAAGDFVKIWLFVEGPERILSWAASKDSSIDWEGKYAHHCHACVALFRDSRVRKVIRECYHEKVEEVLLRYSLMIKAGELLKSEQP